MQSKYPDNNLMLPLSPEEMDELDDFLVSDATSDETMMIDALDGYLTAIVLGPTTLSFEQWFSGIWGSDETHKPNFKTRTEAEHIIDLILRMMNTIIWELEDNDENLAPIFGIVEYEGKEYTDAEMWAYGFMQGIDLCRKDWQPFFDDPNGTTLLRPIYLLGADEVTDEEEELTKTPIERDAFAQQIPASVGWIYRYWLPYRHAVAERQVATTIQREQPKIGRNDLCPCGSGKKFNKCCGVGSVLH
jgi:uncharacterized protein